MLTLLVTATLVQQAPARPMGAVEGCVVGPDGLAIAAASIVVRGAAGPSRSASADAAGCFVVEALPAGEYEVEAEAAAGLQPSAVRVSVASGGVRRVTLRLLIAPVRESVSVVATRTAQPLGEAPAAIHVLAGAELQRSSLPALDAALARVPAFSLFRRSSSLASHPTTHGVSLRGIGASGASRSLVLVDGVPQNDPFGNWVHWSKMPLLQIERVEVTGSGLSMLYGSSAMAGVVSIVTRRVASKTFELRALGGSHTTAGVEAFGGRAVGPWSVSGGGRVFQTDGYSLVDAVVRGAADAPAAARHGTLNWRIERGAGRSGVFFHTGRVFYEERDNGTRLQENDTRELVATAGARLAPGGGALEVDGFARAQRFASTFSALAADRSVETLTLRQRIPSLDGGAGAQWTRPAGAHLVTVGGDLRAVDADDDEDVFTAGVHVRDRDIAARQALGGAFVQDAWRLSDRVRLTLGSRVDAWRHFEATRVEVVRATGATTSTRMPARSSSTWTPRAAVVVRLDGGLVARASAYTGFRAPSLNELYRPFRVGNISTEGNPALGSERLAGGEAGLACARGPVSWQATAFWTRLSDPISNVTISSTPALITRQRQNLGRARVDGIEVDAEWRPHSRLRAGAAWLIVSARVTEFAADAALEGLRLPQVPRHRGSLQIAGRAPGDLDLAVGVRAEGQRFDDDRNKLRLGAYAVADVRLARAIGSHADAFVSVENLFDRAYAVQATPVEILGTPRTVLAGVTVRWRR